MNIILAINRIRKSKAYSAIILLLIFYWTSFMLQNADSLGGTTIAIGMAGTISVVLLRTILPEQYNSRRVQCAAIIFGCFISSASCISNFVNGLAGYKGLILLILAGMIIGYYLFYLLYYLCSKPSIYKDNLNISSNEKADKILFFISFLTIIVCDLFFYLTSNFPGTFSPDSYSSIIQSLSNEYSDHHPFCCSDMLSGIFFFCWNPDLISNRSTNIFCGRITLVYRNNAIQFCI